MALKALTKACGGTKIPGTKEVFYTIPITELEANGLPATEADGAGTELGDKKKFAEAFDFTGAASGTGYFRKHTAVLVNTGQVTNTVEGQIGGQMFGQRYTFFADANDAAMMEWLDDLISQSGCFLALVPKKDGDLMLLGDLESGVYVEAIEGGTGGDRVGYNVTLYASPGKTTYIYPGTLAINTTPAV